MESLDLQVLRCARDWHRGGHGVFLFTVLQTWGSAPRPPGALLAIRDDGLVSGSVSGGCVEDDLIMRIRSGGESGVLPELLTYGVSKDEAARYGLPCGGTLKLMKESVGETGWLDQVLDSIGRHRRVRRELDLHSGAVRVTDEDASGPGLPLPQFDEHRCESWYGPRWRLLVIGAGQLSRILAQMALALDYEVLICDPREEYHRTWDVANTRWISGMPDDVVLEIEPDSHTAIAALTHDPKLDDMALLEALRSPAFYVGALGSQVNNARRRERLALFDIAPEQIARLHGPIGLPIGSRVPAEIAISILAQMTAVKNGVPA
ncbi:XdhC family protein [Herbaspirillum sp. alder98]|uniref:XdhC family protein n=1 Tax=Herbaspirillum sp. alder98 TaxID=2913096 RepID=UPI001CD84AAE|nr:XdhC family protein [Herbaspirillum sp. alder98]MCA1326848.1 XdhC family protein [Herbaspirillum sp. alder98]